ncbi:DUF6220 domain-containing protein [Halobacillus hunanensis]|uniref:DUF6220 domain-containing protein n=1 Tax=Halobacillus hunanensis TaxID=578214 RepID=UPI0015903E51|nr:DUF6220 domain-containing protein [Halobacillus hunanensis]
MEITGKVRLWRKTFFFLAVIFVLTVAIQVFLAGFAIFVDPAKWTKHTNFVKIFEYVPILMLIFSFPGKLTPSMKWQSFGLFTLIILMYATANIPHAGAFHPVIALLIFWMSIVVSQKAWRSAYKMEDGLTSQ